jgi:hypothetical protein
VYVQVQALVRTLHALILLLHCHCNLVFHSAEGSDDSLFIAKLELTVILAAENHLNN